MNIERARQITLKELKNSGYPFEERLSKSTGSVYYKIFSSKESLLFRISDHQTNKNVITFRVDHRMDEKNLLKFVRNRVKDLSCRTTKSLLGI